MKHGTISGRRVRCRRGCTQARTNAMSETVTLEIPDALAQNARDIAAQTHRRVEDVLVEWLARAASDLPIEQLPDDQVLALRDMQMDASQQAELSALLARQREGILTEGERARLENLM